LKEWINVRKRKYHQINLLVALTIYHMKSNRQPPNVRQCRLNIEWYSSKKWVYHTTKTNSLITNQTILSTYPTNSNLLINKSLMDIFLGTWIISFMAGKSKQICNIPHQIILLQMENHQIFTLIVIFSCFLRVKEMLFNRI
jgi:hypothetical protein